MRPIVGLLGLSFAVLSTAASAEPERATAAAPPREAIASAALSPDELEAAAGGQGVSVEVLTRQQLSGSTSGNTVSAGTLTSGDVSFGSDALDGFSGVGNFVINTGANNTLQGAINISVVTTPAN